MLLNSPKDPNKPRHGNYEENSMEVHLDFKKPMMINNVDEMLNIYT